MLTDLLEDQFGSSGNQTNFDLWLVQVKPGPEYIIWQAISFWICPYSDLAIIYTSPYNSEAVELKPIPCLKMQLAPPSIGERVVGFGFYSSDTSGVFLNDGGGRHIEIEGVGAATVGHVKDVHQIKRDSARLTFPCYQVDARFDGGMSGGPVLNDDGELCGVICSSLPPLTDDEEHVSYIATLWPAMAIALNVNIKTGKLDLDYYPLLNLVDMNVLAAKSSERVVIKKGQEDIRYAIEFKVQ